MTDGPPVAPKRRLFNKPNWAAKGTAESQAERAFFSHGDTIYGDILAEKEKRRERHRAKNTDGAGYGRETKRRRVSYDGESDSGLDSSRNESDEDEIPTGDSRRADVSTRSVAAEKVDSTASLSPTFKQSKAGFLQSSSGNYSIDTVKATIIDLGDEDEDRTGIVPESLAQQQKHLPTKTRTRKPASDPESEDEDEFTLELKRKAREKVRLRKFGLVPMQHITSDTQKKKMQSPQLAGDARPGSPQSPVVASPLQSPPPPASSKKNDNAVVCILIRTAIPDTNELIVNRRVTQSLQPVREAWCKRQGFDAAMTRKVFLTWRGNKLFNATTCTNILKSLKNERRKDRFGTLDSDDEDLDPSKGKIEVEAITEEILEERKRTKERAEHAQSTADDVEAQPDEGEPEKPKEVECTICLKSPGIDDMFLKVRATTLVSKVMAGFKKVRQVESSKTCWLIFDGERLEPEATIGDTEIENGDSVDVQIR